MATETLKSNISSTYKYIFWMDTNPSTFRQKLIPISVANSLKVTNLPLSLELEMMQQMGFDCMELYTFTGNS